MNDEEGEQLEREDGLTDVVPDTAEEELEGAIDNIVPTRGYAMTPMVGLGASAGGISALVSFFKAMPADSGMVFVVVLHLSPTHESTLAALLGNVTSMAVVQAENGLPVRPNHVYVIPPRKYLVVRDEKIELSEIEQVDGAGGKRIAVDLFFRSLADTHGAHAVAIVLSGVDGDGALGIKRVKERGGLTIAQDPSESEHAGMPRSAIDTGMVDWVLLAAEIPARLLAYVRQEAKVRLPPEELGLQVPGAPPADTSEGTLRDVLVYLKTRTGRDFSYYKRATVLRRIGRRMQVNGVSDLSGYITFLRTHPGEAGALLQDMLISVTNFFRDRDAFAALEKRIPQLFAGKSLNDQVRIWVPACATGEEAYSLAMLLAEHASTLDAPPAVQVFACDLNDEAIQIARAGHYPSSMEADVSEERIRRFFVKGPDGYRARRELREMVLFASHDLVKDAPFSRMDLISCRNLLIYLSREAQQRVADTFYFALRPDGLLFLGTSEAFEDETRFRVLDAKPRIYATRPGARAYVALALRSASIPGIHATANGAPPPVLVHAKPPAGSLPVWSAHELGRGLDRPALAELHYKLVERYAPPSVVIDSNHDIVHLSEHAGALLRIVGGEPTMNLLRVLLPELRIELRAALYRTADTHEPTETSDVRVSVEGQPSAVRIRVVPVPEAGDRFALVLFQVRTVAADTAPDPTDPRPDTRPSENPTPDGVARHLERELAHVKSHLRDTVEQYEASTEELKASNEELQAMNEELRSATEELETSREELQSINEELSTVNQEMKGNLDELATANSDLQNLMASTAIATIFLDRALCIKLYTPNAATVFNLIPGDVGRPLAHLNPQLQYPGLLADAEQVLSSLVPVEREVGDADHGYLARLQPYRTVEDRIAGVVLTFVDVTERNRATRALRLSEERLRLLVESARDWAIFTMDTNRSVSSWNAGAQTLFGYTEAEIMGADARQLFTQEDQAAGAAEREVELARTEGRAQNERWHLRKDGSSFYGSGSVMPLRDEQGGLRGYVKIMRDLTEREQNEEALRKQMDELTRFNAVAVGRETRMIELKREVNALCERVGQKARYVVVGPDEHEGSPS